MPPSVIVGDIAGILNWVMADLEADACSASMDTRPDDVSNMTEYCEQGKGADLVKHDSLLELRV